MEWMNDARQARAGDAAARERLAEYLTPFVHGVALAHAPHHLADPLVPRVLAEAMAGLAAVAEDQLVGQHFVAVARRRAREAAAGQPSEVHDPSPQRTEARQVVARLRALPEATRERLLLRLVEGVPGPELAQVLRVMEGELKTDLERGAFEAAKLLGQPPQVPGDAYLWDLAGAPSALVARLEMLLPTLRYDGASAPAPDAITNERPATAATHLELGAVGSKKISISPAPAVRFSGDDEKTSAHGEPLSDFTAPGGVERTQGASDLPPQAQANPFEPAVRTVAATDLPVAAQGVVPAMPPPSSRSNARLQGPTGTSKPTLPRPDSASSQKLATFGEPENTKAEVPPALARAQARAAAAPVEGTDAAVPAVAETRIGPVPVSAPPVNREAQAPLGDSPEPTRMAPMPSVPPRPIPALTPRSLLQGSTPFVVAGLLGVAAAVAGWTGLFTSEAQVKRSWTLVPVVVAAADMNEGDLLTPDLIAVRQVPDTVVKSASFVKPDNVAFVLGQRLIAPMQEGDPLCWSHLSDLEHSRRLSVMRRGRAYTIATSSVTSVGRHLKPGDRVDVVASFERPMTKTVTKPGPKKGKPVTETAAYTEPVAVTLMQDILVLATGKVLPTTRASTLDERTKNYANVSVLVLPEEAEQLALATQLGKLTLTMRTEEDHELLDPSSREFTNIRTLITGDRTKALLKKRQAIIQLIRGSVVH